MWLAALIGLGVLVGLVYKITLGTDPLNPDSDLDGMTDGAEVHADSNPLGSDSWLTSQPQAAPGADLADDHHLAAADFVGH